MDIPAVATALLAEARATNERRLLVLSGDPDRGIDALGEALDSLPVAVTDTVLVSDREVLPCERVDPKRTAELLGTTREVVVYDAHDRFEPNALGRLTGVVDGGGLLVLLVPDLAGWPDRRDEFDASLAVPPFGEADVTGRFRERLVTLLGAHPGIAIVNVDSGDVERDGLTRPAPRIERDRVAIPDTRAFPRAAYEACLTRDQVEALAALESLREDGRAVVIEADRGRGKSSAAGLAAGALAADGADVLVTAPDARNAAEVFSRARELLGAEPETGEYRLETAAGGRVRFARPVEAADADPDVLIVDEAAALPVRVLERCLETGRVAFVTTIHGYEGAGRGFSIRFRDRLDESGHEGRSVTMADPIRYAAGDPVEVWAFRALLLDARPPVAQLVAEATPGTVAYRRLSRSALASDEGLLRETFGLLVAAHYRTEPNDLARLLDAPNLSVRALTHDGHVASVALLAREGDLPADVREGLYDGGRIRGNMIPDLLMSQLRDERAGGPVGWRVLRIATHHAVRSRGLGSRLLSEVREEFSRSADWLGVGYGATPELLSFWSENGFSTVHLSTTRNDASGEYSAVMLSPTSDVGRELHDRHAAWFADRIEGVLSDPLDDADPDVVRAALGSVEAAVDPGLSERDWIHVAGAAYGPGTFDVSPGSFRPLAVSHLIDGEAPLTDRGERLLVRKVLQGRPWDGVAEELGFVSTRMCMRALGESFKPLVDEYGSEAALEERRRYADE
ncbi:tRNA(Met) cytidine acetyltransferase TmcA [Halalkalicoccus sp. NIPERK01]|uniref:tRNA(Met) cytidine acetyltransferase TmcA n=1 Tax=Halalkalicoccus sp. NIPERK01 TaxID=3053469 RepID=UPI00256ED690|nr:tRNA(Met) cytidine acetyltransferase TmcA [Halalkalicoccus sp. NIPERK01]MDL5361186.1 tRNA(Met) cytidine acetyltransferase TmcA [Halalkalicoccus sp. NIPERK01]